MLHVSPEYLAGLFDGEGSLFVYKIKSGNGDYYSYQIGASITNTYLPILARVQRHLGGRIDNHSITYKGAKQCFSLFFAKRPKVKAFLDYFSRHCIIKKAQIKLAYRWFRFRDKNKKARCRVIGYGKRNSPIFRLKPEIYRKEEWFERQFKRLKKVEYGKVSKATKPSVL